MRCSRRDKVVSVLTLRQGGQERYKATLTGTAMPFEARERAAVPHPDAPDFANVRADLARLYIAHKVELGYGQLDG